MSLTTGETEELAVLHRKVSERDPETGRYPHWSQAERDRVRELARKQYPAIKFAPSTEEIGMLFGRESRR